MGSLMDWAIVKYKMAVAKFYDETGDVNVVSLVILIGVAVCLAIIFKEQITTLLTSLLETITGKANEAVSS